MTSSDSIQSGASPLRSGVVLVGLGTVGSAVFELLVRQSLAGGWAGGHGLARVTCIDFDWLAAHNPGKSAVYLPNDVGRRKVDAAVDWAADVAPGLRVVGLPYRVEEVGLGPFTTAEAALVMADDYAAKIEACRLSWKSGVPVVMIGELAGERSLGARYRTFFPGNGGACVECSYVGPEYALLGKRFSCSDPRESAVDAGTVKRGPVTRLSAAYRLAASMVEECERLVAGVGASQSDGSDDSIDVGATVAGQRSCEVRLLPEQRSTLTLWPTRNPNCCFDHEVLSYRPLVDAISVEATHELTLADVFSAASRHLRNVRGLLLDHLVALTWECGGGHTWPKALRLDDGGSRCPVCGESGRPVATTRYLELAENGGAPDCVPEESPDRILMRDLVPPGEVLRFVNGESEVYLSLPTPAAWETHALHVRRNGESDSPETMAPTHLCRQSLEIESSRSNAAEIGG